MSESKRPTLAVAVNERDHVLGPSTALVLRAAEAAEAAAAQRKFWEMHRLLYTRPDKLSDRDLQGS